MYAGLDFGTSNCSIGIWKNNSPKLLPLEGESSRLPSALYTTRPAIETEEIDQHELKSRVDKEKRKQRNEIKKAEEDERKIRIFSDAELENIVRGVMRREREERSKAMQEKKSISEGLYSDTETIFGESAILRHIAEPENGYFVKSPKSFLGADVGRYHIELFSEITTRILAFIKSTAESAAGKDIKNIVLGRPVNFHGTRGEKGNEQAIGVLESSAIAAGFDAVEFLMEPIAAALDFERSISKDQVALILDVGGGTTDCSMVKLGPSFVQSRDRDSSVLGYAGDRIGGVDLDIKLALRKIFPYFGRGSSLRNGMPIPNTVFHNAATVNDVNAMQQFMSEKTAREIASYVAQAVDKKKVERLQRLQNAKLVLRLNRSAELAKIHLSDRDPIQLPLSYIEKELVVTINRDGLRESIERELGAFLSLMKEVERQAGVEPDVVYVTGGTAKSPIVEEFIRSSYRDKEIVLGDAFGSVASGLTAWSHRIYD